MTVSSAKAITYSLPPLPMRTLACSTLIDWNFPVAIKDPDPEQFCDGIQDCGAANALRPARVPFVFANDPIAGLEAVGIDFDALDGTWRGPHPMLDVRAFETPARSAWRRRSVCAIAKHEFGIGADVDDEPVLSLLVRLLGQQHAGGVRADE